MKALNYDRSISGDLITYREAEDFARCIAFGTEFVRDKKQPVTVYFREGEGYFFDYQDSNNAKDHVVLRISVKDVEGVHTFDTCKTKDWQ